MVAVAGEALVDVVDGRTMPGGSPFNTARALARLDVPVAFAGRLSTDASGRELARLLTADGVSLELASFGPEPTTQAIADLDAAGGARYRFVVEGTSAPRLATAPALTPAMSALAFGSLGLVLEPLASTLLALVREERARRVVVLDPNVRPGLIPDAAYRARIFEAMSMSAVVKASAEDLAFVFPGLDPASAARELLASGVRLVVVTLGAEGALAACGDERVSAPAVPVAVVDTIGAGDAFGAALIAWLQEHGALTPGLELGARDLEAALEFACMAAAITCTRAGAEPPWRGEVDSAMQRRRH